MVKDLYEYWTRDLRPCIESHGYSLPEPPSFEVFLEEWSTGEGQWNPYYKLTYELGGQDGAVSGEAAHESIATREDCGETLPELPEPEIPTE